MVKAHTCAHSKMIFFEFAEFESVPAKEMKKHFRPCYTRPNFSYPSSRIALVHQSVCSRTPIRLDSRKKLDWYCLFGNDINV